MPFLHQLSTQRRLGAPQFTALPNDWLPWPYVDTLYDYTQFLSPSQPIASFPTKADPVAEVAIVGAGPAGMAAAYELLRAGIRPSVFEATDRIGGRNWSRHFQDEGGYDLPVWAEMGAMRVPASNKTFWYYAKQFGAKTGTFPDPGTVPTLVYYENTPFSWTPPATAADPPSPPPGPFGKIQDAFGAYVMQTVSPIWTPWYNAGSDPDWPQVIAIWQSYLDRYKDMTMFEALKASLPQWTNEEFNAFSALGVGSGGFGTLLYSVSQLELLRHLVNKWDYDQQLIVGWQGENQSVTPEGINGLTDAFYRKSVPLPDGRTASLQSSGAVLLNAEVTRIERDPATQQLKVHWTDQTHGEKHLQTFAAVIVATTTRAMDIDIGLTLPQGNEVNVGSEEVKNAIRDLHLMGASKMFIRTRDKFWLDDHGKPRPDIPQSIQTDELPRQVYCLDYPHTDEGIILLSYTWEDDSTKLLAVDPARRFAKFKETLTRICPQFAEHLVPAKGESDILNIDWQETKHYYGSVKVQLPGQESYLHGAYYQFLTVLNADADPGVYLAGDSISWSGQWTEGALQTGINAACAVAQRLGGTLRANSPLTQNPNLYRYGP